MAVRGSAPAVPVPVFAACGQDRWADVQDLRSRSEVALVVSPRHAAILLVAGTIPSDHAGALDRVHDQLPHPRASVVWPNPDASASGPLDSGEGDLDGLVWLLTAANDQLSADLSNSEPDRLPDEEANEWRGVGPHGQGGEGMMGGTPYGRPMAMTGDDRDGLALDQLHLRLGPFLDALPPGLVFDVTLQGEVIQQCEIQEVAPDATSGLRGEVPTSAVLTPLHRARDLLRHLAWGLHLHGLEGLAARAARLAVDTGRSDASRERLVQDLSALRRRIKRSGLRWTLGSVGAIGGHGTAVDRWDARLDAIANALEFDQPPVSDTAEPISLDALGRAITGLTLTDAVATVASVELARAGRAVPAS